MELAAFAIFGSAFKICFSAEVNVLQRIEEEVGKVFVFRGEHGAPNWR